MLTKEENQLLINKFVEKNVDSITNLNDDKQKAIFNAILLIQNKFGNISNSLLKDDVINPKVAQPIAIIEEELPFKVGDKFYIDIRGKGNIYIIDSIDSSRVVVKIKKIDNNIYDYDYSIAEVKKAFEDGTWIKIEDNLQFQLGQLVWDKQKSELVIIGYKTNDILELVSYRQKRNKSVDTLKEDIKLGASILLKFKVGDIFIDNDGNKYEIYGLTPNTPINVMVIKNGVSTPLLWEYIDNKIIYGEWVLVDDLPFKVGDKFTTSDKVGNRIPIYTILEINPNKNYFEFEGEGVKLNGWSLEEAKELFAKGEWKLVDDLPFKVGDAFKVSKTQLIFKIEEIKDDNVFIVYEDGLTAITSINAFETGLKSGYYVPNATFNNRLTTSFKFKIGDTFEYRDTKKTWTIVDIVKDFDQYVVQHDNSRTFVNRVIFEKEVESGKLVQIVPDIKIKKVSQIVKNQQITTSTTTTTTSKAITRKTKTTSTPPQTTIVNKDEDIEALEEAIETQKLLLTLSDTKEEKDEIKNLLKDLRSKLKFLKK